MSRVCDLFFCSSRRRHTRCALVTGVQTCALPIYEVLSGKIPFPFNALESERKCRGASFFDAAHIKKRFFSQLRDVKIQAGGLCACFGHSVVPTGACSSARQASMPDSPPQAIHGLLSAYPGRDAASGDSLSMLLPAT